MAGVLAVTVVTAAPLNALEPWKLSGGHWLTMPDMGQPRWPLEGERTPPLSSLPRAPGKAVVQVYYRMPGPPPPMERMALLAPAMSGDDVHVFLNGVRLQRPAIATDRPAAAPWSQAVLWEAPADYLRPGRQRLEVVITGAVGPPVSAPLYLGPRTVLEAAADKTAIWGGTWRHRLAGLGLAAALLALAGAALDARRRPILLAAAGLAAAIGARASLGEHHVVTELGRHWGAADRLTVSLGLLSLALLMTGRRPAQRADSAMLGLAAAMALAWIIDFSAPDWAPALASPAAWAVVLAPTAMLVANLVLTGGLDWRGSVLRRTQAVATGAVLALILVLVAWTGLALHVGLSGLAMDVAYVAAAVVTLTATALAAVWLVGVGAVRLVRTQLDQSRIIRRQQAQIAAAATALEQEMRRAATLEERQRLARDMHDGVGGQLVSLIARVRSGRITQDQLEGELMRGLSELRMVVDSLDATGQSLEDALLAFRLRAQTQAEGAGMTLDWLQGDVSGVETGDPRWVLTLYRFMQEAVTNAVRHSGGRRLAVRIERNGPARLAVEIVDDGKGFDPEAAQSSKTGKGLRNLGIRAAQLGGTLTIDTTARGARIGLDLPIPED
ncbi:signal transduction histidine kinase [Caulobacter ginsengisoli]|uniref:Signal transduction histidine kinase n=1 Tax=Caulobacter ginsengisoli TaxID=400775 RepID=A0ABU0IQX6_9CAUL|nr:ATP-binding protein [Caulobacter ginsengisoli]MDQ0463558.1 signal transduction histidine kinase [Caulobacter ginsengisoli]